MPSARAASAMLCPALKQWSNPGNGPIAYSSSRMRAVSSSASRVWTTRGRPDRREASMWARKLAC